MLTAESEISRSNYVCRVAVVQLVAQSVSSVHLNSVHHARPSCPVLPQLRLLKNTQHRIQSVSLTSEIFWFIIAGSKQLRYQLICTAQLSYHSELGTSVLKNHCSVNDLISTFFSVINSSSFKQLTSHRPTSDRSIMWPMHFCVCVLLANVNYLSSPT